MVAQSGACSEPLRAVLACFAKQQQSSWECDEDGNAAIKDGFCDTEQAAFARCAQSH
jgi:hypothetical protein